MEKRLAAAALILTASTALSCDLLRNLGLPDPTGASRLLPPVIEYQGAVLVEAPSQAQMQAHFCPQVVPDPFGVRGGAAALCAGFFGRAPSAEQMRVSFDLRFKVKNPNQIPLPLAEILTAVTVFPQATNQNLGAVCTRLCGEGEAGCTGQPGPGSCQASSRDIRSLQDFAGAAAGLVVSAGIALATGGSFTFQAPRVTAASELDVVVRFSFGPQALLTLLRQLAAQSVEQLRRGQSVVFTVPYRLEGTIWADAGSFGRLAVGFGPSTGEWVMPAQALVPRW